MSSLSLNLLTRLDAPDGVEPLERIWSIEAWLASLERVRGIERLVDEPERQLFRLVFDAGRETPDIVTVERMRTPGQIAVRHLVPPPGVASLDAVWWVEPEHPRRVFARRAILLEAASIGRDKAFAMFELLRENLVALMGAQP